METNPRLEGLYEVSDRGEIRSVERRVTCSHGFDRVYKSQYIKQVINRAGYKRVKLYRPGESQHLKFAVSPASLCWPNA